jgi:ELP3 family radical SAM enzyme/protein acetyltransferase
MDIEDLIPNTTVDFKNKHQLSKQQLDVLKEEFKTYQISSVNKFIDYIRKKHKFICSKIQLVGIYNDLKLDNSELRKMIIKKISKSYSGIVSVTILTSGNPEYEDENGKIIKSTFSCKHDCHYCPNEKPSEENNWVQQPRSYLFKEPAVLRANENKFDPILQMNSRISCLISMGHAVDKLEVLILGGTWSEYPLRYRDDFIRKTYYAANTFYDIEKRPIKTLEEEITENEDTTVHIIGLTLEMRPDNITLDEIKSFRRYNCTRVQLGIQHTNDYVLKKINRGHNINAVYNAIKLLKNNCYKIDGHFMPNLPYSSPELDDIMVNDILYNPRIQLDQLKIYPCAIVPFTKIKKWYDEGVYVPYDEEKLYDVIKKLKMNIQKSKRLNRIIRDIPYEYIKGGYSKKSINLRQEITKDMKLNNWCCMCIRCREIRDNIIKNPEEDIKLLIDETEASDGKEYFISFETDKYMIGFLRLRINHNYDANVLDVLKGCGLIRELHVYSMISIVGDNKNELSIQHKGYGTRLIKKAEEIIIANGLKKSAIISGTGVRNYYRKFGYELKDTYMIKDLFYDQ